MSDDPSRETREPIMVGQTYRRVHNGRDGILRCDVRKLDGNHAMCFMYDAHRDYGVKPVPMDLLHSEEFARD